MPGFRPANTEPRFLLKMTRLRQARETLELFLPFFKEIVRRQNHQYYTYVPDTHPQRNQLAFLMSEALVRLLFGGNQSGKSRSLTQEIAWWLSEEHPYQKTPKAPRIYVVSASYRTIQEGVWRHLKSTLPEWEIESRGECVPGWDIPHYLQMKRGGRIDFISGEGREEARRKVASAEVDLAVVDEEIDGIIYEELQARRLARAGRVVVAATLVRSEPWCVALEEKAESGDPDCQLFRLSTYVAAQRGHVKQKIVDEIAATHSPEDVRVRLHGESRKSEGLIYPELSREHFVDPFEIPRNWTRFCALDPGVSTFAVLWCAVSPEDLFYVYRELYEHSRDYRTVADLIFRHEGFDSREVPVQKQLDDGQVFTTKEDQWFKVHGKSEDIETHWIDPAAKSRAVSGHKGTKDLLADYRLYTSDAENHVESGIQRVKAALLRGLSGVPQLRIFNTCKHLMKEMRAYRWIRDTRNPNVNTRREVPVKQRDHLCDCLRYLVASGMYYVPKDSLAELFREQEDTLNEIKITEGVDSRRFKRLQQSYHRHKHQDEPPAHVGGLGTEY